MINPTRWVDQPGWHREVIHGFRVWVGEPLSAWLNDLLAQGIQIVWATTWITNDEMLDVLGLIGLLAAEEGPPEEAVEMAGQRDAARRNKDWAEADRLRDELRAMGWEVRDGPDGPDLVRPS